MHLNFGTYTVTGPGGKKNRQKERRLMKGFNLASGTSSGSGSGDTNMQIKFSGKFFEQFVTVAAFYLMEISKFTFIKISFTHVQIQFIIHLNEINYTRVEGGGTNFHNIYKFSLNSFSHSLFDISSCNDNNVTLE